MLSRRGFLVGAGAMALGVRAGWGQSRNTNQTPKKKRIIVVGAGISGLAAAQEFVKGGWETAVLEAGDRIGGRIYSRKMGDSTVELGARWFEGEREGAWNDFYSNAGVELVKVPGGLTVYDGAGKVLEADGVERELNRVRSLISDTRRVNRDLINAQRPDVSMLDALREVGLGKVRDADHQRMVRWAIARELESKAGCEIAKISLANYWARREEEPGNGELFAVKGGLVKLLEPLAKGVQVQLNMRVTRIAWNESQNVATLSTNRGQLRADGVLVTVPLGVLKAGGIAFEPALPDWKTQSLAKVTMRAEQRTVMLFDKSFWPDSGRLAVMDDALGDGAEWVNWKAINGSPILEVSSEGAAALRYDANEKSAIAAARKRLATVYGKSVTTMKEAVGSHWLSDPNFLGAGVVVPMGTSNDDVARIAAPMGGIYFAGEAFAGERRGTVGGAYLTGVYVARGMMGK